MYEWIKELVHLDLLQIRGKLLLCPQVLLYFMND